MILWQLDANCSIYELHVDRLVKILHSALAPVEAYYCKIKRSPKLIKCYSIKKYMSVIAPEIIVMNLL
jgi:hypothetical protein